jgi:predicted nucleic acid-binding protein
VAQLIAIYDACVLYPAPLRDFLMQVALSDLVRAKWTNRIHDEWIRNLLENRPDLTRTQLERTRQLMNRATRDSVVEGYEALVESLQLPDEDDRHVLAAAIHAKANIIVTFNLKDFPPKALRPHKIEALHPDEFIMRLISLDSPAVCDVARLHRARLRNPPKSVEDYLQTLGDQGLAKTTLHLAGQAASI